MSTSADKENKKVNAAAAKKDADVKEGTGDSIRDENNNKQEAGKQTQSEEYIEQNGETKE